jgi:hypothetical protein
MSDLSKYAAAIVAKARRSFTSCEVFGKVLTRNDDSGRHGVLIPSDAYSFFPHFPISDPTQNATLEFAAFNSVSAKQETFAYKYYERYPERRITRLPGLLNALDASPRILICLRAKHPDGSVGYYFDCGNSATGGRFDELFRLIFGTEVAALPGNFVIRPIDSEVFSADASFTELLEKFDGIKERGWIDSLRTGDTGIGYTFETLLGIQENNDQRADFQGIEIKCKGTKEGEVSTSSKINLFQAGPVWLAEATAKERIRILGRPGDDGLYACYSQVTATPNNLGLLLDILHASEKIDLRKSAEALGFWRFSKLAKRLAEKHSRAAFVKARVRNTKTKSQYAYEELVYCDQPSIERFVKLVADRNIVFEFTMSEKPDGTIRNHGYPWRLIRAEFLDQLFAFQIKLR